MPWIDAGALKEKYADQLSVQRVFGYDAGFVAGILAALEMPTLTPPNEWVSVEERSPKLRENVLVCAYWHEHWGVYMGWNSGHGWYVSCGLGQRSDVKVSHWMPLPAPPDRRPPEEDEDARNRLVLLAKLIAITPGQPPKLWIAHSTNRGEF